jgi:hypothetical protein
VFVVPRLVVSARSAASLAGVDDPAARGRLEDERLKLQNHVRIGLLQGVAGVAVIAAVVVTWQQLETDRRQLRQQLAVAGAHPGRRPLRPAPRPARQRAAGRPPRRHLRPGGFAARATQEAVAAGGPAAGSPAALQIRQADVDAAVTALARRTVQAGDQPLDLSGSLLPGARLGWARLAGARASADTRWPDGFGWRAAGARMVDAC